MNIFNFYHYKTLSAFQTDLSSGTFTENDLAFIKESKQLYTHGQYYDCTGLDEQQIKDLEQINVIDEVLSLTIDKMVKANGLNADLIYIPNNEIIASASSIAEALELLANFQSTGGIPEAPSDNKTYGRNNGKWVKVDQQITIENVSENTKEIHPNKYYMFGEMTELTITLAEGEEGKLNEYMFEFTSGTTPTTLTLPESVKWMGEHTIEASKTYQVSIVNNIAVIGGAS